MTCASALAPSVRAILTPVRTTTASAIASLLFGVTKMKQKQPGRRRAKARHAEVQHPAPSSGPLLQREEVLDRVRRRKSWLYSLMKAGLFPQGSQYRRRGPRLWCEKEVYEALVRLLVPVGGQHQTPFSEGDSLLILADILKRARRENSWLYALIAEGRFPAEFHYNGKGSRVWIERQVEVALQGLLVPVANIASAMLALRKP